MDGFPTSSIDVPDIIRIGNRGIHGHAGSNDIVVGGER
jgi:hypothetical protein